MTEAQIILRKIAHLVDPDQRLQEAAMLLLGKPYGDRPLAGGPGLPESPAIRLDCMDCMTYLETAVGFGLSSGLEELRRTIIRLRYSSPTLQWDTRLHYFFSWLRVNQDRGLMEIITPAEDSTVTVKTLSFVPGIPTQEVSFRAHAWHMEAIPPHATMIGFVSERNDLDVFHVGILCSGGTTLLHASRREGCVIKEPLQAFLDRETGLGLLLAHLMTRG